MLINEKGIDAALLDINLGGEARSFELATQLQAMRIPFAFVTGYPAALRPPTLVGVPTIRKPYFREEVANVLTALFLDGGTTR